MGKMPFAYSERLCGSNIYLDGIRLSDELLNFIIKVK